MRYPNWDLGCPKRVAEMHGSEAHVPEPHGLQGPTAQKGLALPCHAELFGSLPAPRMGDESKRIISGIRLFRLEL